MSEVVVAALVAAAASIVGSLIANGADKAREKAWRESIDRKLDRFGRVQNAQSKSLLSTMQHIVTGNHVEQLSADMRRLQDEIIDN